MSVRATPAMTAVVADDEPLAREELAFLLREFSAIEILSFASNGLEALEQIEAQEPDIVFLDVQMPGLDGVGVVRRLQEREIPLPFFVFATAFENYAVEAFRLEASDYLLKPIERARLQVTIERIQRQFEERSGVAKVIAAAGGGWAPARQKLVVRTGSRNMIVDSGDVIYATIDNGLITVVTTQFEGETNYRTIEELQSNLDPNVFWRVHRSYLVNVNRIKEVIPWFKSSFQLRMDDRKGTEIPVSRVQTKRLRDLFRL